MKTRRKLKILFLIAIIITAYLIFGNPTVSGKLKSLGAANTYFGMFLGGLLFAFGFSSPIAIGMFLILNPSNLFLAAFIGAIASVIGDIFILNVMSKWYVREFKDMKKSKMIEQITKTFTATPNKRFNSYMLYTIAALIIVLPIPDEIGIGMLAGFTNLDKRIFCAVSFVLHLISIYVILLIPI